MRRLQAPSEWRNKNAIIWAGVREIERLKDMKQVFMFDGEGDLDEVLI